MHRHRSPLSWKVGLCSSPDLPSTEWAAATVPGAVQLDWARLKGLPDYTVADNVSEWRGLSDCYWRYESVLPAESQGDSAAFLVVEGVDYAAQVFINGAQRGFMEGTQTSFETEVTEDLRAGGKIEILLHPAPKSKETPEDRSQANASCKSAVSYGWDFHPRLIPLGLWKEAYIEYRPASYFSKPHEVAYQLETLEKASGTASFCLHGASAGMSVTWSLYDAHGAAVLSSVHALQADESEVDIPFQLESIKLWWPHDQGEPYLYRSEVTLKSADGQVLDVHSRKVGFRRVRLVMAEDQWLEPNEFPKSRSLPPMTLEINGRALFVKGSNWVCPDVFPGTLSKERYEEQLTLARHSNLSMLRMWGGAVAPHECFYELCDEMGLLVWQEFPLGCNLYPDTPEYLRMLDQESRSLILRLRGHACLVLWCGGNELFNAWSGMTDQSLPIRLLNRNCYDLDPDRPFLSTAPMEGMGHGHYVFRDPQNGEEAWALFQRARCTAYTEFGCPSPASASLLKRIIPPGQLWPPKAGTAWETHHAFRAWMAESHLYLKEIEYYFGRLEDLEALVEAGQLLQGCGYQGLFEEARRQKPRASMALNWCLNEPWPSAANNSLISWPCEPKPALAMVAAACRKTLASARIEKFSWQSGESFSPEIWLLHDGPEEHESVTVSVRLEIDGVSTHLLRWETGEICANRNIEGPRIRYKLPVINSPAFTLHLEVMGRAEWNSTYTLRKSLVPIKARSSDVSPVMNL